MTKKLVYIGLGSNLDSPVKQIITALQEIEVLNNSSLINVSELYVSKPFGENKNQPDFFNVAAVIKTSLTPFRLLHELKKIEIKHKRKNTQRWGARTLDLDILLYGCQTIRTRYLTIPHIQLIFRNFVLYPLADLDKKIVLPNGIKLQEQCLKIGKKELSLQYNKNYDHYKKQL